MEQVQNIISLDLTILKSNPPQLLVRSIGQVSNMGWKNGRLERIYYIHPPADGIQEFDFVAEPPFRKSGQIIFPIPAEATLSEIPEWLKGVRVASANNKVEVLLEEAKSLNFI